MIITKQKCEEFQERGYFDPVLILSEGECQTFLQKALNASERPPLDWGKGHACSSRLYYEIGTHPAILNIVRALIGEDVLLWGASMKRMGPGAAHPWHSDIETSATSGKTVSVWIGMENTSLDSSLALVPYSHRFGVSIQQERHSFGKRRDEATDEDVLGWAKQRDDRSHLAKPMVSNGDALFFDGRLWHSSHNTSEKARRSLLLQYATPDTVIRMPDQNNLEWPFQQMKLPRPGCLIVSGSATVGVNRIVPAPLTPGGDSNPQLTSRVYPLKIPLLPDEKSGWKEYPVFNGSTPDLNILTCHVSALSQFRCLHPPHTHDREEILLVLAGEVELNLPDLQSEKKLQPLKPHQLVYYPCHFAHTLTTTSSEPANYLMLKWSANPQPIPPNLSDQFRFHELENHLEVKEGYQWNTIFEAPTTYLHKLHCHTSTLTPGAGYGMHVDSYDVCIIVLEGEVETLGERLGPYSVLFHPAGEPHDLRNPGEVVARYVVFEFHGRRPPPVREKLAEPRRSLLSKIFDPQCWIRAYKTFAWRMKHK